MSRCRRIVPDGAILVPECAHRVFKGEIFDVYQWEQILFDGSHATFEMLKRPDTVKVIAVTDGGEIIMCNEMQPGGITRRQSLPGGRVDQTDISVVAAAQRELAEETGYTFHHWGLLDTVQRERKIDWFVYTFIAWGDGVRVEQRLDSGEDIEIVKGSFADMKAKQIFNIPLLASCETVDDMMRHCIMVKE